MFPAHKLLFSAAHYADQPLPLSQNPTHLPCRSNEEGGNDPSRLAKRLQPDCQTSPHVFCGSMASPHCLPAICWPPGNVHHTCAACRSMEDGGKGPKRLYLVSAGVRRLLLNDVREALKVTMTGLKLFERQEVRVSRRGHF